MQVSRRRYADCKALVAGFCENAAGILDRALRKRQRAGLVLPGGGTPRLFLPALARCPLDWRRVGITLSDERWVPVDSEDSNEYLVRSCLLAEGAEGAQLTGLKTTHATPAGALTTVAARLAALPRPFDLTVLGLGRDGHVASLFPGQPLNTADGGPCLAVGDCPQPAPRISLTLDLLAAGRHLFLVYTDAEKSRLVDAVLAGAPGTRDLPVSRLLAATRAPITLFETGRRP